MEDNKKEKNNDGSKHIDNSFKKFIPSQKNPPKMPSVETTKSPEKK